MAETGPTEMVHSRQDALREEDDVWAGHPQTREIAGNDEYVQPGERVCSQDAVCCCEARRDQLQKGLVAGTLEAHWGKDPMRNNFLGGGRRILEATGIFHVTTSANIPEVSLGR